MNAINESLKKKKKVIRFEAQCRDILSPLAIQVSLHSASARSTPFRRGKNRGILTESSD